MDYTNLSSGNAIKFTEKGKISFALFASAAADEVIFQVTDSGPGISDSEKDSIFTRFYRSEQNPSSVEGTGIGLSLVKELVSLHHGTVTVSNANSPSSGSTFTVKISRISSDTTIDDNVDSQSVQVSKISSDGKQPKSSDIIGYVQNEDGTPMTTTQANGTAREIFTGTRRKSLRNDTTGMHLMVIDDNSDMRNYVTEILCERWNVHAFRTAEDALEALKHLKIDLIVSDILLPKMSGVEFTQIIRENQHTQDLPVFLLTAKSTEESRINGLLCGADDYIIKPFSRKELVSRVNTRLELQKLRKELEELVSSRTAQLINEKKRFEHLARFVPIYFSDKYWGIIGVEPPENPTEFNWIEMIKPEYLETVFSDLKVLQQEKRSIRHEFQFKNGTWIVAETIPDIDEVTGELVGSVGCLTNITETKVLEMQRLQAMEEAERVQRRRADEAEEMKKQKVESFIDMICHEIRNPLSAILSNNELIGDSLTSAFRCLDKLQGKFDEFSKLNELITSIADCSKSITICAKHQKNIADDVLHMSKLSLELVDLHTTDFDTVTLAQDVLSAMEADMKSKKIESQLVVLDGIDKYSAQRILGDPVRITQVMVNFMTNAIKFTSKADIRKIEVQIDAYQATTDSTTSKDDDIFVTFAIKDSGIGMNDEQLSKLFQRFQQATQKTYAEYGGSGLGLFISKKLVELMGGSVDVQSELGKGTTFKFSIKSKRYDGPDRVRHCSLEDLLKKSRQNLTEPATIPKILVVDDNDINRKVLSKQLAKEGFETEEAINGLEALKKVTDFTYSLILMDVEMPVMDGPTAVTKIRELESQSGRTKIPIVSVTGNARDEQIAYYLSIGVQKVLIKPYTREKHRGRSVR
ncbi:hypothetical protein HDU76_000617 [Blyttiomyces sp. JEL0837]|nr:hypothetical protein HDU76_000617 [Blyttiomyces sp. JEL0837]